MNDKPLNPAADECRVLCSKIDGCMPGDFLSTHHVHILVSRGEVFFSDGKTRHTAAAGDLAVWQMSSTICGVDYSADFECEFLIVAPQFLVHFNPEMVWAARGYVFIRLNPVFHLGEGALRLMESDFVLFRRRQDEVANPFRRELMGRVLQMFLFDMWHICSDEVASTDTSDNAAQLFFRYLSLVQSGVTTERSVAAYADRLCITPKYLSQVCRSVTGLSAMQWIEYYTTFELVSRLDNNSRTLADIADEMGFSSIQFFSRYVKKLLGMSPSDYRRSKGL